MVLPITAVNKTLGDRLSPFYELKNGYRQKKPYTLSLTLDHRKSKYVLSSGKFTFYNPGQTTDWCVTAGETNSQAAQCDNGTYARFMGKLRAQDASLGITLGEHKAARDMIITRTKQLYVLSRGILRRNMKDVQSVLGDDPRVKQTWRKAAKDNSGRILEYSWGWRPMIEDIGNALETLVSPLTPIYVRASNSAFNSWYPRDSNVAGHAGTYAWRQINRETWDYYYRSSTGAKISVNNYNVSLANRLGIINIPQIIWATYPMSFLVDKYVNIGQMIGSLTDTYGFTLTDPWTNRRVFIESSGYFIEWRDYGPGAYIHESYTSTGRTITKRRNGTLLTPTFQFRQPSIGSFSEAVSYMALLVQLFTK